jgi:hypothetical protein
MDATRSPEHPAERFDVASLVHAAVDDALPADAPSIDGDLDAIQISAIVAAQTRRVAGSAAESADLGVGDADAYDPLAFVPDRRTADRLALAISDWAARQRPTVIEFLYLATRATDSWPLRRVKPTPSSRLRLASTISTSASHRRGRGTARGSSVSRLRWNGRRHRLSRSRAATGRGREPQQPDNHSCPSPRFGVGAG